MCGEGSAQVWLRTDGGECLPQQAWCDVPVTQPQSQETGAPAADSLCDLGPQFSSSVKG